ncbi:MAG: hypothetical protein HC853_00775 [Anaerolineae bacterium]|nr:hypothetical protein [Anaerolineae bacterium]
MRQFDTDVADAQDLLTRLERQLVGAKAQLGTDWEYLPEYNQITQELVALKAEMDAPDAGVQDSPATDADGSSDVGQEQTTTALALPEALNSEDETDPLPSANVLASQVLVREAIEAVWEMHRERYRLTDEPVVGDAGGDEEEIADGIESSGVDAHVQAEPANVGPGVNGAWVTPQPLMPCAQPSMPAGEVAAPELALALREPAQGTGQGLGQGRRRKGQRHEGQLSLW